jgi:hypothetical protein
MKFPDSLGYLRIMFGARFEQVLGLVLEMIEVRIGRKWFYGHARTPFLGRLIVCMLAGRKLVRKKNRDEVDFCPFHGPGCALARV